MGDLNGTAKLPSAKGASGNDCIRKLLLNLFVQICYLPLIRWMSWHRIGASPSLEAMVIARYYIVGNRKKCMTLYCILCAVRALLRDFWVESS